MRGRWAALGLVGVLVVLAGCGSVFGPSQPNQEQLNASADYQWDTNATTSVNVSRSSYRVIISVENRSHLEVYRRSELGTENPVDLRALRFRHVNGTVVNASAMTVENTRSHSNITLPATEGQVAYTTSRTGKRFAMQAFVEGSYEVTLPPGARVGIPLLSEVRPGNSRTSVTDDRMTIRWSSVEDGRIVARYYLARDIYLFGGLLGLLVVAGAGGALYYLRQIRALERKREEVGLDVETEDDDFGDGPPPGMR